MSLYLPLYERALRIAEAALGGDHPNVVLILENYADLLREMGKVDEAATLERRAGSIEAGPGR